MADDQAPDWASEPAAATPSTSETPPDWAGGAPDWATEQQKSPGALASAARPITDLPSTFRDIVHGSVEQVKQGVKQLDASGFDSSEGLGNMAKGLGNVALGGLGWASAPLTAPLRTFVGQPTERAVTAAGGSERLASALGAGAETAAGFALPLPKVERAPVIPPARPFGVTLSEGQETGNLLARQREQAALRGAEGEPALTRAKEFEQQQTQQLSKARQDITGELGQPPVQSAQDAADTLSSAVTASQARIDAMVANNERTLANEHKNFRASLSPSNSVLAESPLDAADIISGSVANEAERVQAAKNAAYEAANSSPGRFPAASFNNVDKEIRSILSNQRSPTLINPQQHPLATGALNDLDDILSDLKQTRDPDTGRIVPKPPLTPERVETARQRLNTYLGSALQTARSNPSAWMDVNALRDVVDAFDTAVSKRYADGRFIGGDSQQVVDAFAAARKLNTQYRQTYTPQGAGDVVGQAVQKILGRYEGQAATPEEIQNLLYGKGGLQPKVAQRLLTIFGKDSPEFGAAKQGFESYVTERPPGAQAWEPEKVADRIDEFTRGPGRTLAQKYLEPQEISAWQGYAQRLRQHATMAEQAKNPFEGVDFDTLLRRGATGDSNALDLLGQVPTRLGPTHPAVGAIPQGLFHRALQRVEGVPESEWGPGKQAENLERLLNKTRNTTTYSGGQRNTLQSFANLLKKLQVPQPGANWSNTATFTQKYLNRYGGLIGIGVGDAILHHLGIPGGWAELASVAGGVGAKRAAEALAERKIAKQMPLVAEQWGKYQRAIKLRAKGETPFAKAMIAASARDLANALQPFGVQLKDFVAGTGSQPAEAQPPEQRASGGAVRRPTGGAVEDDEPPTGTPSPFGAITSHPVLQMGVGPGFVGAQAPGAAPMPKPAEETPTTSLEPSEAQTLHQWSVGKDYPPTEAMTQATSRLPAYNDEVFRGALLSPESFANLKVGFTVEFPNHASASKDSGVAETYARGEAMDTPVPKGHVPVVYHIPSGSNARDLTAVDLPNNFAVRGDEEVVVPPNRFQVSDIKKRTNAETGKPVQYVTLAPASAEPAPPLYSAMEKAVQEAPQNSAPREQWQSYLENQPGVKPEELDKVGLPLFGQPTRTNDGSIVEGPITKDQLLQHIGDNKTQLEEAIKAEPRYYASDHNGIIRGSDLSQNEARDMADELGGNAELMSNSHDSPRYSDYQMPGGDNYRELLLKMPLASSKLSPEGMPPGFKLINASDAAREAGYQVPDNAPQQWYHRGPHSGSQLFNSREEAIADAQRTAKQYPDQAQFNSSHWPDDPNTMLHLRMNDRDIPGVGKSLHLEELQSDWHQKGRKQGYDSDMPSGWTIRDPKTRQQYGTYSSQEEAQNALPGFYAGSEVVPLPPNKTGVPDAPFKTSWPELGLKRAIAQAAQEGKDAISWTPGQQQADRYDLSKHVDSLEYNPERRFLRAYKDDVPVLTQANVTPDRLSDYIGKEAAKRLLDSPQKNYGDGTTEAMVHELEGEDLKIGGEGMKGFYDTMLPNIANKIGKKYGAKVEWKDIPVVGKELSESEGLELQKLEAMNSNFPGSLSPAQNARHQELMNRFYLEPTPTKVPVLRLTPQLKAKALQEGFGMYARGGAVRGEQEASSSTANTNQSGTLASSAFARGGAVKDQHTDDQVPRRGANQHDKNQRKHCCIDARHDIVSGADSTPRKVEIDEHIPEYSPKLRDKHGKPANLHRYLAIHEGEEAKGQKEGMSYAKAHAKRGIPAERKAVEADGVSWKEYTEEMAGYLSHVEHEKVKKPPPAGEHVDPKQAIKRAAGGRVVASNIDRSPSGAQKAAGNYAKDHVTIHGLDIAIENAKGHTRRGVGKDGKKWEATLPCAYGYIRRV